MKSSIRVAGRVAGVAVTSMLLLGLLLVAPASAAAPTGFSPSSGPPGTTVTISGTFTLPIVSVTFGGVLAFGTPVGTTSQVTAVVPPNAPASSAIAVTDTGGGPVTVPGGNFTVTALPAPTVTNFSPVCGTAGTLVTLTGTNLIGVNTDLGFVKFNNVAATTVTILSNTQVQAVVPATTTGPITVRSDALAGESAATVSGPFDFTYSATCVLTVTGISPTSGAVGTSVTITGTNFPVSSVCTVTFSSNRVTTGSTNSTGTQITATVPAGAVTGPVLVSCPSFGAATTNFTVTAAPLPTITSFTPAYGPTGKTVTITGTNFSGTGFTTTSVKFNNVTATFTVNSATQITATVPATATTGKITVTTPGGTATSTTDFVVSVVHSRTVSLALRKHLIAKGEVSAGTFSACVAAVEVKIQRLKSGNWKTVGTDTTSSNGSFKTRVNDKTGKYRARATKVVLGGGANVCAKATSPTRNHNH